jgi:hypothetical protein
MDFLTANLINTTTQISLTNQTALASSLFNRDEYYQYYTDGLNNDLTSASITITFGTTTSVSRIALIDTNLKDFTVFYNGVTASTFTLVSQATTASSFTGNADENVMLRFATIGVSSVTIQMKKTITADQEKILGLFYIGDTYFSLGKLPNASNYKPQRVPKEIVHTLSEGGTRVSRVREKFDLSINLDYVSASDVSSLKDVKAQSSFNFAAFSTSTGWTNPVFFEAVWPGSFNFYEFSDEVVSNGFSGNIKLKETPA